MSVKEKTLRVLYEREAASWKEIFLESGVSRGAVSKTLSSLVDEGSVEPFLDPQLRKIKYRLTEDGWLKAQGMLDEKLIAAEIRAQEAISTGDLLQETVHRLCVSGAAMDIQPPRFWTGFLIFPFLKDLTRSFLLLGENEKKYLHLLAGLMIDSVVEIIGKKPETWVELRCGWQLAWNLKGLEACVTQVEGKGFIFNYPKALQKHASEYEELQPLFKQRRKDEKSLFYTCLITCFPTSERRQIAKQWFLLCQLTNKPIPRKPMSF